MIVDKAEFEKFYNILPELEKDELFFCSLSARNKYLSQEERDLYGLGRTEMFSREVCREKKHLYFMFEKLQASLSYRKTKAGLTIPEKSLVTYMNINPSSAIKAFMLFQKEMNEEFYQIYSASISKKQANYEATIRLPQKLMNCIQRCKSRRYFIDIDCDVDNLEIIYPIIEGLNNHGIIHYVIKTKSGFHILILKDSLKKEFKLHELISESNKNCKEVRFNSNEMIPVPGTLQAGALVYFVKY